MFHFCPLFPVTTVWLFPEKYIWVCVRLTGSPFWALTRLQCEPETWKCGKSEEKVMTVTANTYHLSNKIQFHFASPFPVKPVMLSAWLVSGSCCWSELSCSFGMTLGKISRPRLVSKQCSSCDNRHWQQHKSNLLCLFPPIMYYPCASPSTSRNRQ